ILEKLLDALEAMPVHDIGDQGIALALAQLIENGLGDALPVFRLITGLDGVSEVASDTESFLGRMCCADYCGTASHCLDGNAELFYDLQNLPEPPDAFFLGEIRGLHPQFVSSHSGPCGKAQMLRRCPNLRDITPRDTGYALAKIVKEGGLRLVRVSGCRMGAPGIFEDTDEIVRASGEVALQTSVIGQAEELPKKHGCPGGCIVGG